MIGKILSLISIGLVTPICSYPLVGQPQIKQAAILQDIIAYAKVHSVRSDSVDWTVIEKKTDSIHTAEGVIQATQYMLKSLNDFHGKIWYEGTPYVGMQKDYVQTTMVLDSAMLADYRRTAITIEGKVIGNLVGYIRIPGLVFGENDSLHAHMINNIIVDLSKQYKLKGWIVDLRLNGGGTMYPMLSGLNAFLGTMPFGSFIDPAKNYKEEWRIRNGEVHIGDYYSTEYELKKRIDLSGMPMAVLISAATTSSGEVVAIAFKHRPRTLFIGEDTAGFTTTVSWQEMGQGFVLQLTESWYADRIDIIYYGSSVRPDRYISGGNDFKNLDLDRAVIDAMKWLGDQ